MTALRTLPDALARSAARRRGLLFRRRRRRSRRSYAELQQAALRAARLAARGRPRPRRSRRSGAARRRAVPHRRCSARRSPVLIPAVDLSAVDDERSAALLRADGRHPPRVGRARAGHQPCARGRRSRTSRRLCPELSLILCADDLDASGASSRTRRPSLDDIAFVQFTSGSTSAPKGVALTHANVSANIDAFIGPSAVAASSDGRRRQLAAAQSRHGAGRHGARRAVRGRTVRAAAAADVRAAAGRVAARDHAPPRHRQLRAELRLRSVRAPRQGRDLDGLDLSRWRVAGCGAEPIHPPTLAAFAEKFAPAGFRDTSFLPCYGLAEHVLAATFPPRGRRPRIERVSADDADRAARGRCRTTAAAPSVALVSCGSRAARPPICRSSARTAVACRSAHVGEILLAGPVGDAGLL